MPLCLTSTIPSLRCARVQGLANRAPVRVRSWIVILDMLDKHFHRRAESGGGNPAPILGDPCDHPTRHEPGTGSCRSRRCQGRGDNGWAPFPHPFPELFSFTDSLDVAADLLRAKITLLRENILILRHRPCRVGIARPGHGCKVPTEAHR